jgi:hypothetical protein
MFHHEATRYEFLCGSAEAVGFHRLLFYPSDKAIQPLFQGDFRSEPQLFMDSCAIGVSVANVA